MYTTPEDHIKINEYMNKSSNVPYSFIGNGKCNISPFFNGEGEDTPKYFMKNISCANGIKEVNFIPSIYCNNNKCIGFAINGSVCNRLKMGTTGPTGTIKSSDTFNVNCGNHPITFLTQNDGKINYACGLNETESNESSFEIYLNKGKRDDDGWSNNYNIIYDGSDDLTPDKNIYNSHFSTAINIQCPDNKVLTSIKLNNDLTNKYIQGICKKPKSFIEKNVQTKNVLFTNNNTTDVTGFDVQVDDYVNPLHYWGSPKYGNSTTSSKSYVISKSWDKMGFSMSCRDRGISGIEQDGSNIKYTCGTPIDPEKYSEYSYVFNNINSNKDSYHPELLYDHIKCPENEILVSFSTLISKDGPKVNYVCGKKKT